MNLRSNCLNHAFSRVTTQGHHNDKVSLTVDQDDEKVASWNRKWKFKTKAKRFCAANQLHAKQGVWRKAFRTSTRNEAFSLLICLDAIKFVLLSFILLQRQFSRKFVHSSHCFKRMQKVHLRLTWAAQKCPSLLKPGIEAPNYMFESSILNNWSLLLAVNCTFSNRLKQVVDKIMCTVLKYYYFFLIFWCSLVSRWR